MTFQPSDTAFNPRTLASASVARIAPGKSSRRIARLLVEKASG
jgi:hypothetical protein